MVNMVNWPVFYGSQAGYEQVEVDGEKAAKIDIHEAIHLSQCATRAPNNSVYIDTPDGETLKFPKAVPETLVKDIRPKYYLTRDSGLTSQLNPLLSPSLNHVQEEVPSFFEDGTKYLTTTRYSMGDSGSLNPLEYVAIIGQSFEQDLGEPLTEAVVSTYLRREGYIVDKFNEGLAKPDNGRPDLFAVKLPEYQRRLADEGITNGGFYLNELELPAFGGSVTKMPEEEEAVVLEVESVREGSFYDGKDEAGDYLSGGWFDAAYGVRGFAEERLESWRDRLDVGYITFDSTGEFTIVESPECGRPNRTSQVRERVRTLVKLTLLKNLPLDESLQFLGVRSFYDTVPAARETDLDEVLAKLRESGVLGGTRDTSAPLSR